MPLILAIEPDSRQAEWIGEQVRGPLGADYVVTDSVQAAIKAIEQHVPDLILTSTLLSPRDESTLQDYMRRMDATGIRVQTLVIPMLAEPSASATTSSGMLSVLRKLRPGTPSPSSGGCDPAVFARQIAEYLDRDGKKAQPGRPGRPATVRGADRDADRKTDQGTDRAKKTEAAEKLPVAAQPAQQHRDDDDGSRKPERRSEPEHKEPEHKNDEARPVGSIFAASDRAWRPSARAVIEEFDPEALLSLLDQVAQRRQGQQLNTSGESHPSHS